MYLNHANPDRSKAVSLREKDAVMGLCSQIGDMYTVHHIWRYTDLEHRKSERDLAWQSGEWANLVIRTGTYNCCYFVLMREESFVTC